VLTTATRPALLAASDAVALVVFVSIGLLSHDHRLTTAGYAHDALALLFGAYRRHTSWALLATWALGISLGVLIRALVLGRPLNADQAAFLGVALCFTLLFVLTLRFAVSRVATRN
jgi:hypothetical protein